MTSVRTRGDPAQFPTRRVARANAWRSAALATWLIVASSPSLAAADSSGAPASIDSLFGDTAAAKDSERDVKLSGYVGSELAYTFASPAHWSRMLIRAQLDATGAFSENVKWKLSGRADYDAVYNLTDFYPPPVAHDARFEFFARENYLDVNADNWNFRLGRQHIVWGEVIALFAADVVSAKDLREFILPDFSIVRIPQWAARAEYFKDDFHAEFVWIPVATYNEIGVPGAEFYAAPPTPPGFASVVENEQIPSRSLSHTNYGLRMGWLRNGWDGAVYYYGSMDQSPTFYRRATFDPQPTFVFQPRHERINQGGFTIAKDFGFALLKAEAVYTSGRKYNVNDIARPDGLVGQNTVDWVASAEFGLPVLADTRLTIQGVQRIYVNHDADLDASKYENGYALYASTQLAQGWEATVLWGASFNRSDSMFRASLARNFQRNWRLAFGVDVFDGSSQGIFGQFGHNDRVYAQITYSF